MTPIAASPPGATRFRCRGFSLVELIVSIVIVGILAAIVGMFIGGPIEAYSDLRRRAVLVDAAESALRLMAREMRKALPNSVRVTNTAGGGFALELVPIVDGGRYQTGFGSNNTNLNFGFGGDQDFDNQACFLTLVSGGPYSGYRIAINNRGTTGNDVYTASGSPAVITPVATTITITDGADVPCTPGGDRPHVHLSASHRFNSSSPENRFFVVQTPVTYLCDTVAGTLTRYANYPMQASQPATAAELNALSGVTSALVSSNLGGCSVTTTAQDIRNRGLATLSLTLSQDGESIRLIHQVQLDNSR